MKYDSIRQDIAEFLYYEEPDIDIKNNIVPFSLSLTYSQEYCYYLSDTILNIIKDYYK